MRSYRIVRLAGLHYAQAMQSLYKKNSALQDQPYIDQQKRVFEAAYVYGDAFSRAMTGLGHEAHEIVYDLEPLQKAWAKEHNVSFTEERWQTEIVLAQLKSLQPDVLYLQDIYCLPLSVRLRIKELVPSIKVVLVYKGYPGDKKEIGQPDALFVATPTIQKQYTALQLPSYVLYHAFNPHVLELLQPAPTSQYDFTFLGSSGFGRGLTHYSRYELLHTLLKKTDITLWIDEKPIHTSRIVKENLIQLFIKIWSFLSPSVRKNILLSLSWPKSLVLLLKEIDYHQQHLPARGTTTWPMLPLSVVKPNKCHDALFGLDMYRVLAASRITLNRHTDGALKSVGNLRLFESTGVGTCLLTDTGDNMADIFEEGKEVVTYSSPEECLEKVDYLLDHEQERQAIAAAGQARTLRDHTVDSRCQFIDSLLQEML